jgi:hypothetical protein
MNTLTYRCVDTMKFNKDGVTNQMSDANILQLVTMLRDTLNLTHIAIATPINSNAEFIAEGTTPSPRTAENHYLAWTNAIHSVGLKVLHRGTLCELEGIWSFTHAVGVNRVSPGTAASAATDGSTTLLGRFYPNFNRLCVDGAIQSGDILAFCPERTEGIFDDATAFLPASGIQAAYTSFFNDMKSICDSLLTANSITGVITGYTANNWSEVNSGWITSGFFSVPNIVSFDHYGSGALTVKASPNHPPLMNTDLRNTYTAKSNRPMFHQEWADHWSSSMSRLDRFIYLKKMYHVFKTLADEGKVIGFNYWGAFEGSAEQMITGSAGSYSLAWNGKVLASFFDGKPMTRIPIDMQ